jgi:3-hydroxymyristoyl/3-hydroxydecanoyl-(acyl carrier protein) dehydratase
MSRVTHVEGPIGGMKVGSVAVIDYDVPRGEWYFEENNARAMPFAVMLETALQPCGWLASYVGGALGSEDNLYFRNLDGTGTQHREIPEDIGTVTTHTRLTNISTADSTVIMSFDVVMRAGDEDLPMTAESRAAVAAENPFLVDLDANPAPYCEGTLCIARERLRVLDRLTGYWPEGGRAGLGRMRAEKAIVARQWFFKAHFYQDPVQPGSLGLEALLQALQALAIERGLGEGVAHPRFETQAAGVTMRWKYRGQVIPENRMVVADVEITEVQRDARGVLVVGEGSLWVDGKRIYEAKGLGVRIVAG